MPPEREPTDFAAHMEYARDATGRVFGHEPSLDEAIAYLKGIDAGSSFLALRDFQTWLTVQLGRPCSLTWPGVARLICSLTDDGESVVSSSPGPGTQLIALAARFSREMEDPRSRAALYRTHIELA